MGVTERIAAELAAVPSIRSMTGVFVRMAGPLAVVNVGDSTITIPCIGFYPPAAGMVVQVEWRDGKPAVTGPARPLNPIGTITATGSPRATVSVDGESYLLYYRAGYTPGVGHTVEINWATGIIQGQVTGVDTPTAPETAPPKSSSFSGLKVKARESGRYQGSWWGDSDPWASNSNDGIWTYGNRIKDAIAGATISKIEIYLPLLSKLGNASIGTHPHSSIPGGAPNISNLEALSSSERDGWVRLPLSFATYLAAGGRGLGVTAPGGGLNKWRGVDRDSDSGALRFAGTR